VGYATIIELKGNFGKSELIVDQQFLGFFYSLLQVKVFNSTSFHLAEKLAQGRIFFIQVLAQPTAQGSAFRCISLLDVIDDQCFYLADQAAVPVFE